MKTFFKRFFKIYILVLLSAAFVVVAVVAVKKLSNKPADERLDIKTEAVKFANSKIGQNLKDGTYEIDNKSTQNAYIKPDKGWFVFKNGMVTDFTFYYIDANSDILEDEKREKAEFYSNCYVSRVDGNIVCKELTTTDFINVCDYGAVAGDLADDTDAIRLATAKVNETGGILYFPHGKYNVSVQGDLIKNGAEKSTIIKINSEKDIIIDFFGSSIELAGTNFPNNRIVFVEENKASVEIKNGTLIGDRKTHNYKAVLNSQGEISSAQGSYSHCFGFGIYIKNTRNGNIYNMEIYDMTGDAIVVKNGQIADETGNEYKTTIDRCDLHHCRRQGITIGDSDYTLVKNTNIYNIGHADDYTNDNCLFDEGSEVNAINGQLPMSGIDVEPDSGSFLAKSVVLDGVNIYSCTSYGIVGNKSARVDKGLIDGVEIKNSSIETYALDYGTIYNSKLIVSSEERSKVATLIRNCKITNSKIIKEYPYYEIFYFNSNEFLNCTFESVREDETTIGNFMFEENNKVVGCKFLNLRGSGDGTTSYIGYGISLYRENSFNEESHSNIFENCDILIRDPHHIKSTEFKNCVISLGYPTGDQNATQENPVYCNFTNVKFYDCSTNRYVSGLTASVMTNCEFYGLTNYLFGTIPRVFINCKLEFNNLSYDKNNNTPFFTVNDAELNPAVLDACEVRIKGEIKDGKYYSNRHVFGSCYLKNNTVIILEEYNDEVKLKIPNDNWGPAHGMPTDPEEYSYVVHYKGNNSLNMHLAN